ncbi:C-type lectin 37Db-like [Euwallacea fornicatus]|uniref:C-type lectin 37Db-like n=1 Tax=Euwallacea fornicatus TaxID=995702 RepID=UPI00338FB16F
MCKQVKMERCGTFIFICNFVLILTTDFTYISATEHKVERNAPTESDVAGNCRLETKYVLNKTTVTWFGAYIACLQNGMDLAIIKSQEEEQALETELTKYCISTGITRGYWIGGSRQGSPNDAYLWFATGEPMVYNKFSKGQPDRAGGVESCVHLFNTDNHEYFWNDWGCMNKIGFICQVRKNSANCCNLCNIS